MGSYKYKWARIKDNGSLTANSNGYGAGIGGSIVIVPAERLTIPSAGTFCVL